jgi:hypothetical protein
MVGANEIGKMGFRPFYTSKRFLTRLVYSSGWVTRFAMAKGQGRRKSSKVLQDFNDKVGSSHDAQVAALSEESRGARWHLTVFKSGNGTNSLTNTQTPDTPTPMFQSLRRPTTVPRRF